MCDTALVADRSVYDLKALDKEVYDRNISAAEETSASAEASEAAKASETSESAPAVVISDLKSGCALRYALVETIDC